MARRKKSTNRQVEELDGVYLLKMVCYLILGAFWIRFSRGTSMVDIPIPIGLIAGILLARHEKLQIDRKLEYAILLMAMFIGFWLPLGLTFNL